MKTVKKILLFVKSPCSLLILHSSRTTMSTRGDYLFLLTLISFHSKFLSRENPQSFKFLNTCLSLPFVSKGSALRSPLKLFQLINNFHGVCLRPVYFNSHQNHPYPSHTTRTWPQWLSLFYRTSVLECKVVQRPTKTVVTRSLVWNSRWPDCLRLLKT